MATSAATISAAMELINPKIDNLKKSFEELQCDSDVLSLFSLTWSDLDSHFTTLHNSLTQKFQLLQTLESQSQNPSSSTPIPQTLTTQDDPKSQVPSDPSSPTSNLKTQIAKEPSLDPNSPTRIAKDPSPSSNPPTQNSVENNSDDDAEAVPPRQELVSFCEKMDAIGLRKYIGYTKINRNTLRSELHGALRLAQDPGFLILNAMEGFYGNGADNVGDKNPEMINMRSSLMLLEVMEGISPDVSFEVRERAKRLALKWKGKVDLERENQFEVLGFLNFVKVYGLVSEFDMDVLLDHLAVVARFKQANELYGKIGSRDKLGDLIKKLVSKGKNLLAVKFISEYNLTDKFPPVPILKAYVKESKRLAKKVCDEGNNSKKSANEAIAKETGALKSVVRVIKDLKLGSEYPPSPLENRIKQLEKEKANRKRQAAVPAGKPLHLQQHYGQKRPRMTAPAGSAAVSNGATGLLLASPISHVSSAAAPYVMSGTAPRVASHVGSSTGQYHFVGGQMGFPVNPGPSTTPVHTSKQQVPSGYYNRVTAYDGYGVSLQYHPSYYHQ